MPNQQIYNFLVNYLRANGATIPDPESSQEAYNTCTELVAQYLFRQLAASLVYLHEQAHVVHRDIKPDNILFTSKTAELKLTDFTVSRNELEPGVTRLYDCEGTPCFTAPECHVVEKDGYDPFPTDIWSFGVCLYTFCNFGALPFYG